MIPLFADQPRNSEMLARHGGAIALNKMDIPKPEVIRKAVVTILEDPRCVSRKPKTRKGFSYAAAAAKLANMLKEQPISAKELVVRHCEFVAKSVIVSRLIMSVIGLDPCISSSPMEDICLQSNTT